MEINDYTSKELEVELERRRKVVGRPPLKSSIDLISLRDICSQYMDEVERGEICDDSDNEHYIFETAIETFYGKDVWTWINDKIKGG